AQTFMWRAHIARGPLTMMDVVDQFDGETGSTVGRLFGRFPVIDVNNEDTRRSAAGRAAIEAAMFAPSAVLPSKSITWRAISENEVEAAFDMPPERPVIRIRLSPEGQIEQLSMMRWGTVGVKKPQYIPIGCDVHEERRFGNYVIPSRFSVGWWWGSPLHEPFFEAEVVEYAGVESTES
ncbi:MAG TPA: DUF6544 family protein, partial [Solirubrobacterales bacterium]|nr:DUF6544 family protein [Solirubrobacterales bacterium]